MSRDPRHVRCGGLPQQLLEGAPASARAGPRRGGSGPRYRRSTSTRASPCPARTCTRLITVATKPRSTWGRLHVLRAPMLRHMAATTCGSGAPLPPRPTSTSPTTLDCLSTTSSKCLSDINWNPLRSTSPIPPTPTPRGTMNRRRCSGAAPGRHPAWRLPTRAGQESRHAGPARR